MVSSADRMPADGCGCCGDLADRYASAVLIMADAVTASMIHLLSANKGRELDYDKIIDSVFRVKLESGVLSQCLISMQEIT